MPVSPDPHPLSHPPVTVGQADRPATLLLLAAIAGAVDAIGFVELNGLFASFMSGNATRLGLDASTGQWGTAGLAGGLMLLFTGGVAAGTLIGRSVGRHRVPLLLALGGILLAISAALGGDTYLGLARPAIPSLVIAMGLFNTIFGRPGVTFVTGALIRIGEALGGRAGKAGGAGFDAALVVALISGVATTAALYPTHGVRLLWAGAMLLVAAAAAHLVADRNAGARSAPVTVWRR